MKIQNSAELAQLLIEEWDYVPSQAPDVADKLLHLPLELRSAFEYWLETAQFPDTPEFANLSPQSLNQLVDIKPPAIFLLLDWLRRAPEEAMQAINEELVRK